MTEVAAVDIDGLLAEIFLTPEGRANPYPRYAAIREHARGFRSNLGFVVVARYDDCRWVLRDPRFGKGEPGRCGRATA
jgi:cytochrome P450